jgi:glutathionylspermidine synthase
MTQKIRKKILKLIKKNAFELMSKNVFIAAWNAKVLLKNSTGCGHFSKNFYPLNSFADHYFKVKSFKN